MNIFEKRPLCLVLCIGLSGFLLFSLESLVFKAIVIIFAILLCILSLIFKITGKGSLICFLLAISLLLSSALSFLYFELYFKAYNLYDDRVEVVGVVEDVTQSSSYSLRLLVKVDSVDNAPRSGYHFYVYTTKSDATGVIDGARISFTAKLTGFSDESYTYNLAKGINAYAGDVENLQLIEYTNGTLKTRFNALREYLTRYAMKLSSKDGGAIVAALLLGERDYLPDQLRLDFKRIGISHILALSGMHLAILSVGIGKLLSLAGLQKKIRVAVIAVFVILYMTLTGFSVSVVRAGVMLLISSALFLLSRSKDSFTSLSVAILIICIFSPNSIMDISLWLSALATFGIIAFSEFSESLKPVKSRKNKILRSIALGILASIFAISATIGISTISFGGISILAPIATLIFSFIAEIIMYLGCLMLIIGWIVPVGWLVSPLCRLLTWLAGVFSDIKWSYVSSSFDFVIIVVAIYSLLFYLYLLIRFRKPIVAANILVILFTAVTILPTVATITRSYEENVVYYSDYKADELLIRSENEVCLINSSQYSKNLAYTSLELLENANVTYLDKYYLTHYSWSIDDEIEVLMYNVLVKKIYLPEPQNEDEETILKIILKSVEDHRTDVVLFKQHETVEVGKYTINLLYSEPYGETSKNAFCVAHGDEVYTYLSSGMLESKLSPEISKYLKLTDHLILGDHGKKYKNKIYIEDKYNDLSILDIY